jgi:hypothetical protein
MDETETETIPNARPVRVTDDGEVIDAAPHIAAVERAAQPVAAMISGGTDQAVAVAGRRLRAIARDSGLADNDLELLRKIAGRALRAECGSMRDLSAEHLNTVANWISANVEEAQIMQEDHRQPPTGGDLFGSTMPDGETSEPTGLERS